MSGSIALSVLMASALASQPSAPQAAAESSLEFIISEAAQDTGGGSVNVSIRVLNSGAQPKAISLPARIQAELQSGSHKRQVWLVRRAQDEATLTLPATGFAQAHYLLPEAGEPLPAGSLLSISAWSRQQVVIAQDLLARNEVATLSPLPTAEGFAADAPFSDTAQAAGSPEPVRGVSTAHSEGSPFLGNLSTYEPMYMVYGPSSAAEAKIQISLKYRLFGSRQSNGLSSSWRDGMHFAFTQKMFWDLGADSSPFRNIDYMPELFYLSQSAQFANGMSVAGQAGVKHESNGRDGSASRSINMLYLAPMAAIPLDDGYRLIFAPRLSFLIGDKSDNPDILEYRGNTAVFVELGKDEGLKLASTARFNFGSGKGSLSTDISYPLTRLLGGGPDFYLYVQSFIGYGENLLEYNHHTARLRAGLAIVR